MTCPKDNSQDVFICTCIHYFLTIAPNLQETQPHFCGYPQGLFGCVFETSNPTDVSASLVTSPHWIQVLFS